LDGTAEAEIDYVAASSVLTFLSGEVLKSVTVPLLPVAETKCVRFFSLRLHSVGGGAFLRAQTNAMVTIFEDYTDIIPVGFTECITVTHSNALQTARNDSIGTYSMTPDGRYALFDSGSSELVPNDHNGQPDVFRRDLTTGVTRLISMNREGTGSGNGGSMDAGMSDDGRYVVFRSFATDLTTNVVVADDLNLFLRDTVAGTTRLLNRSTNGAGAHFQTWNAVLSGDGMTAAFISNATDLDPDCNCASPSPNIYAVNLSSGETRLVTKALSGGGLKEDIGLSIVSLTPDGRFLLFLSRSDELVEEDAQNNGDVFVANLVTGETILISKNYEGTGSVDGDSFQAFTQISPDGRFVLFTSSGSDLVPEDEDGEWDVFQRDLSTGITKLVSANWTGTNSASDHSFAGTMTPDGRYVTFVSRATDLLPGYVEPNGVYPENVFLRDMLTGTTTLVSATCQGQAGIDGDSFNPVISPDGKRVFFSSSAGDLVPGSPGFQNIYVRDLAAGVTTLISANVDFTDGGSFVEGAIPSADGKTVIYSSADKNLAPVVDNNGLPDLFVWRLLPPGTNALVNMKTTTESKGQVMVTSLAVTNLGPDLAHNVVVTNIFSSSLRLVDFNTTGGSCSVKGSQIVCTLGTLPRRGGVVVSFVATAVADGLGSHATQVTSTEPDPVTLDNAATRVGEFTLPAPAMLSIVRIMGVKYVSWLATPDAAELQWTPFLDPPGQWVQAPPPWLNNGVLKTAPIPDGLASRFFRLHEE
jgi:uncharacterized repeat protein (TIGR01451 family)